MISAIFEYRFLLHAVIASVLSGIVCGIIGTYIVTNRIVFLSGGIAHASFGGLGLAWYLNFNPILGAAIFSVLTALGIEFFTDKTRVRNDSIIGIWWSMGMALGIFFIYLSPGYTPNLMNYLFGSILTIETFDLYLIGALALVTILFFTVFYRPILFISFDSEYVKTHKIPVAPFKYILMSLVALSIVFSMKIAGIVLIISLLTIPQAIANQITNNFKYIMFLSILFAILGSLLGLTISWYINVPSGATIIFSLIALFVLVNIVTKIIKKS
ncbi:MAG TPA: metal ABC transporter permease [Salinivirgaceae bacterium]|nr:metal ABC transporter permease [Salinivirgaceae bacterium]